MPLISIRNPQTGQVRAVDENSLDAVLTKFRASQGFEPEILGPSDRAVDAGDFARAKTEWLNTEAGAPENPGIKDALIAAADHPVTRGALQGATGTFGDEWQAFVAHPSMGRDYVEQRDEERARNSAASSAHPYQYGISQVAGSIPATFAGAALGRTIGSVAKGAELLPALATATGRVLPLARSAVAVGSNLTPALARIGGTIEPAATIVSKLTPWLAAGGSGALIGVGSSEADNVKDIVKDAAPTAALGVLTHGAVKGVVKAGGAALEQAPKAYTSALKALASEKTPKVAAGAGTLVGGGAGAGLGSLTDSAPLTGALATGGGAAGGWLGNLLGSSVQRIAAKKLAERAPWLSTLTPSSKTYAELWEQHPPWAPTRTVAEPPLASNLDEQLAAQEAAARAAPPRTGITPFEAPANEEAALAQYLDGVVGNQTSSTGRPLPREEAIRRALATLGDEPASQNISPQAQAALRNTLRDVADAAPSKSIPKSPRGTEVGEVRGTRATRAQGPTKQASTTPAGPQRTGTAWDQLTPEQLAQVERTFGPLSREVSSGAQPLGPDVPSVGTEPRPRISSMRPPVPSSDPAEIVRQLRAAGVVNRDALRRAAGLKSVREVDRILENTRWGLAPKKQ